MKKSFAVPIKYLSQRNLTVQFVGILLAMKRVKKFMRIFIIKIMDYTRENRVREYSNVISLDQKRKLRDLKLKEKSFKKYLTSLKQEQLQFEANYIINKINDENLSDEFLLKSALLMDELAQRVSVGQMAHTINKYATNLRSKMELEPTIQ